MSTFIPKISKQLIMGIGIATLMLMVIAAPLAVAADSQVMADETAQNDVILGAWEGVGRNPKDPAKRRADTFLIVVKDGRHLVTLTGVKGQKPYSYFGNFFEPPIGQVVFDFWYDRQGIIHGTYFRHYRDPCFSRQLYELSGTISPDHKHLRMQFTTEEYYESHKNPCNYVGRITWQFNLTKAE
ncbi:hypothetical protein ACFL12_07880 [Pseudomonadota bacterium]